MNNAQKVVVVLLVLAIVFSGVSLAMSFGVFEDFEFGSSANSDSDSSRNNQGGLNLYIEGGSVDG